MKITSIFGFLSPWGQPESYHILRTEGPETPLTHLPQPRNPLGKGSLRHGGQVWVVRYGGWEGAWLSAGPSRRWAWLLIVLQLPTGNCPPTWALVKAPGSLVC